ncbi:MAG: TetR/AcrR family transcriptional regulator [Bacteroidales bacterium]|nr:TetR/AcrR family transcriptional regulator [Bacteroidales bacterium]
MKAGKDSNTEQSILETAERLFLRKGYAMTSTTEIAREVGCNQALVHYYFRTKDKLFEAIFEKKVRLFVSTLLTVTNEEVPFEEKLRKRIEAHFEIIRANPRIPFLFFNELTTNPERLKAFIEKIREIPKSVIDKIGDELQSEIQKGNIRPMKTFDLIVTIVALNVALFISSPVIRAATGVSDEEFNEIVERRKKENVLIILRSLKP